MGERDITMSTEYGAHQEMDIEDDRFPASTQLGEIQALISNIDDTAQMLNSRDEGNKCLQGEGVGLTCSH